MALPEVADLKRVLRVQTSSYDTLLQTELTNALAVARAYLGRPIAATEMTWTIEDPRLGASVFRGLVRETGRNVRQLRVPVTPVEVASVTLTDGDGTEIDAADVRVNATTGVITAVATGSLLGVFDLFPYTLTATVGLGTRTDYTEWVEPVVWQLMTDIAADFYQRRNPAALYEASGGGVAVTYNQSAETTIPSRIQTLLAPFRLHTV